MCYLLLATVPSHFFRPTIHTVDNFAALEVKAGSREEGRGSFQGQRLRQVFHLTTSVHILATLTGTPRVWRIEAALTYSGCHPHSPSPGGPHYYVPLHHNEKE